MSVDLSNYLPSFQYQINPPGQTLITLTDDEAIQRLVDGFWSLRLAGVDFLSAYTCTDDGIITPQSANVATTYLPTAWYTDDGSTDLGREVVQAIILFAGLRCVQTQYMNLKTMVRSQAGNVSFETQQSATVLLAVLKSIIAEVDIVLTRFSDLGSTTVTVLDSVINNTINVMDGDTWWIRGSYGNERGW